MDYENELAPYDRWREKILGGLYAVEGQITSIRLHMKNIREKREESDFFYRCVRSLAEADLTVEILAAESGER